MSQEFMNFFPFLNDPVEKQLIIVDQVLPPAESPAPVTPEHVQAVDAAFTHHDEDRAVAGLMGLWSSTLLLNDLAKEHFHVPADEELKELQSEEPDGPDPSE
jgi:hypothetical protein